MTPRNEDNFLVEIPPEAMEILNREWYDERWDEIELHFSPYWGKI